jgi:hypothetical protein
MFFEPGFIAHGCLWQMVTIPEQYLSPPCFTITTHPKYGHVYFLHAKDAHTPCHKIAEAQDAVCNMYPEPTWLASFAFLMKSGGCAVQPIG